MNKRNDKGCQVVVKLNQAKKSKFILVLSKVNENKLHFIFDSKMIPARECLLLPAFYKSNDWNLDMTLLSQNTQNTNNWIQRDEEMDRHGLAQSLLVSNHLDSNRQNICI